MLTPAQTHALLRQLGHQPRKALGQNFLVDANIVRKSLQLAQIVPGDTVVEIGPGLGTLTQTLLQAGATVYAVEADPALHQHLSTTLAPAWPETFKLLHADAVHHPRAGLPDSQTRSGDFKIVANLPYAISTPWLEALLAGDLPRSITVMVQKEAGERFLAEPGSKQIGAVSLFLQAAYRRAAAHPVARTCFHPAPAVDSLIIHLERLPNPRRFPPETRTSIRQLFTQRRKQIGGLIRRSADNSALLQTWLEQAAPHGVTPQSRPEQVPLDAWLLLAQTPEPAPDRQALKHPAS